MQPLRWERRPDGLRAPALVCAFKGWNDAGESATSALTFVAGSLGARAVRGDRPRGVRRLPVHAPDGAARRRRHAHDRVARVRDLRRPHPARPARPGAALRPRAGDALAHVLPQTVVDLAEALGVQMVVLLGALLADVPHSRPVSVTAHASDPALIERLGAAAADLRGPDGDRRRPARRLRRRRPARRLAVGRRAALRRRGAEPEGRARAAAPAGAPRRRHRRRDRARGRRRSTTSARSPAPSSSTPTCRRSSSASSAPPTRRTAGPTRARCRRGDVLAREFQRFLRQRGDGGRPRGSSALGRRAGDPVVAHRARRPARRRLEALRLDPVGDRRSTVSVIQSRSSSERSTGTFSSSST